MSMDRRSGNSAQVTTIVPALPLPEVPALGYGGHETGYGLGAPQRQERVVSQQVENISRGAGESKNSNGPTVINGVPDLANEQLSKPPKSQKKVPRSVWRNKNLKPIEFGNAVKRHEGYPQLQGVFGSGGVRFGDLKLEEDLRRGDTEVHNVTGGEVRKATASNLASHTEGSYLESHTDGVGKWDPVYNGSNLPHLHQHQEQRPPELSPERHPNYVHQISSITTPPPTAMSQGFQPHQTSPYHHIENKYLVYGAPGGRPYPPFFPHAPAGYTGIPPPSPHHQQPQPQSSQHPSHRPTDSASSSIDGLGGYRHPQQAPHTPQMLPLPPQQPHPHFSHLPPHLHPPSLPYPVSGYSNSMPSLDPRDYHTQNSHPPQPPEHQYPNFRPPPGSDHSRSGSSGHISPFPPPTLPPPLANPQEMLSYRPTPQASPIFQQFDGPQPVHQRHALQNTAIPVSSQGPLATNEKSTINHILGQFGRSTFADLTLNLAFLSSGSSEDIRHCLEMPFHTMVAGRIGTISKALSKRGWAGPMEVDRLLKISLDDILNEEVMEKNVRWTMGNLRKFLTETAVTIALVWAYGCNEQSVGDWFDMKTTWELQNFLPAIGVDSQLKLCWNHESLEMASPSSASREEAARGNRSAAPSPEPATVPKSTVHAKPPPRDWADDHGDDTEDEDSNELGLERELSRSDTQATTPHHETSPGKAFTNINTQTIWSSEVIHSQDTPLQRILSVLAAAVLLDIPDLVGLCGRRLIAHIPRLDNSSSGLEVLDILLSDNISPSFTPTFSAVDRFSHVYGVLRELKSTIIRNVIGRSLDRLVHSRAVEEQDRRALQSYSFDTVVKTALELIDRMPHLPSVQEKIRAIERLLHEERNDKGWVVAARLGSTPTLARLERGKSIRFGQVWDVAPGARVIVGKKIGKKWVWVE